MKNGMSLINHPSGGPFSFPHCVLSTGKLVRDRFFSYHGRSGGNFKTGEGGLSLILAYPGIIGLIQGDPPPPEAHDTR